MAWAEANLDPTPVWVDVLVYVVVLNLFVEYFPQVQTQLWLGEFEECDFISFHPGFPEHMQLRVITVPRDETYIKQIEIEVPEGTPPAGLQIEDIVEGDGPTARAGDTVTVQFDLRGREGRDGRVWNTLSIWRINVDAKGAAPRASGSGSAQDDIPFRAIK